MATTCQRISHQPFQTPVCVLGKATSWDNQVSIPTCHFHLSIVNQSTSCVQFVATKMWCLGRILPLVIGEWVPEDQPQYRTFLLLRTILDITMAPVTSPEKVMYLREIIDEHHQLFRQSYPTSSVTPKMHYITHLPQWMMR